ncbi:MAG: endonuclease/exonuclease/phosphatase family protein [Opitutales bacterium]
MKCPRLLFLPMICLLPLAAQARDFSVLAYNVENLFDIDGVALFEDYQPYDPETESGYGPQHLLVKLTNIATAVAAAETGGPDIILFSELEFDRTPGGLTVEQFLTQTADANLEDLLIEDPTRWADVSSQAWLAKALAEDGMTGYRVAVQEDRPITEFVEAHTCAVFSRFPITAVFSHPIEDARDLLEVHLEVEGHPLIVFSVHWKSGASNPEREPIRIQNATVLRQRLNELREEQPQADILLGGDFNSSYNQLAIVPGLDVSGINSILQSSGDEDGVAAAGGPDLYNLWYELPAAERGSEVYRGDWGTLMHLLLTPGLYDRDGIVYIDNSFERVILPGENVLKGLGTPRRWYFAGPVGGGYSDHLPIQARFRTGSEPEDGDAGPWIDPTQPHGDAPDDQPLPIDFASVAEGPLPDAGKALQGLSPAGLASRFGEVFAVEARIVARDPLTLEVGGTRFGFYTPFDDVYKQIIRRQVGHTVSFIGQLGSYRGRIQFVIQDPTWWGRD